METLNLLVVDDEPGMCSAIRRALATYEIPAVNEDPAVAFAIDETDSAEAALEKIAARRVDILLLDYKLPQMSGMELLQRIADSQTEVTTVMMTAYASIETAVTATRRGAYDFLAKPFTPDELKSTVYRASRVRLLQRRAHRLMQEKRRFRLELLTIVSHELKRPLAAVETYLNIIRDHSAGDDPAVYQDMIERCRVRTGEMRKLIMDLLDSARIESGQHKRCLEPVDLLPLLEGSIAAARSEAEANGVEFVLSAPERLEIQADRNEMQIIFNNLVSNAVKYNRRGGTVTIRLASQGTSITLCVADTGIGIGQEDQANIFKEFSRIKNEKTQDIPGSGLGLSIVKRIVDLYGGTIHLQSRPDEGTTFTVTLPWGP
jgi:two-component system sensor histidine kinase/response regulator